MSVKTQYYILVQNPISDSVSGWGIIKHIIDFFKSGRQKYHYPRIIDG
jgi:hypothetical protein